MSDFAKFCPKCYAFFRDPDLHAKHVEVCGYAKNKDGEAVNEIRKAVVKEMANRRRQIALERSQEQVARSQNTENKGEQNEVENESSDTCIPTPDSSPQPSAVATEGGSPQVKSPKFKT